MLRNIVRSGALKSIVLPVQQSVGIQGIGARSLWHMSKPSTTSSIHKCSGFGGCRCGCGTRFASTNGKRFYRYGSWTSHKNQEDEKMFNNYITSNVLSTIIFLIWFRFRFIQIGEKALIEFLQEEIETEKSSLAGHLPSQLDSFQIKFDGAEVELNKQVANEKYVENPL